MLQLVENQIIAALLFCSVISCAYLTYRYIKYGNTIFIDARFWLLLFIVAYLQVPVLHHLITEATLMGHGRPSVESHAKFVIYVTIVFLLNYVITARSRSQLYNIKIKENKFFFNSQCVELFSVFAILLDIYVCLLFVFFSPSTSVLWSDRALASQHSIEFNNMFKFNFVYMIQCAMVLYICFQKKKVWPILLNLPFVFVSVAMSDRSLIYQFLCLFILSFYVANKKMPVYVIAIGAITLLLVEVIRASSFSLLDATAFLIVPGELLFTSETSILVMDSGEHIEIMHQILRSLLVLVPFREIFGDDIASEHFSSILVRINPFSHTGLGGSLLSEAYTLDPDFLIYFYPFLLFLQAYFWNHFRYKYGFVGVLGFLFFIQTIIYEFRSGLISNFFLPFYYLFCSLAMFILFKVVAALVMRARYKSTELTH